MGWEGIADIGVWLDKAEEWLARFFKEGWSMDPVVWEMLKHMLPGYRYRRILPEMQIIALPGEWQDMPAGIGGVRVRVPAGRKGIGAVVEWEDTPGSWRRWEAGASLVRERADEIAGFWVKMEHSPMVPGDFGFDDESLLARHIQAYVKSWQDAVVSGLNRVSLIGAPMPSDNGEVLSWAFHNRAPPAFAPGAALMVQAFAMVGLPVQEGIGIPLRADVLDARRRAGRSVEMHDAIQKTQVVLVGLGSLGSEIAHLLAQEGIRHFYLVDGDAILPGNEARHRAGLVHAGRPKVEVVEELIRGIQPEAKVLLHHGWLDDLIPELTKTGSEEDTLFIGATGDEATEHFISDIARECGDPAIHAWLEQDGTVVRVARYIPGIDPTLSAASKMDATPRMVAPVNPKAPRICGDTVLPGSALNLHAGANFAVRVVLDLIGGHRDGPNHWLFAPGGTDAPDAPAELKSPYGVFACRLLAS